MEEDRYLEIIITPSELGPNLKENIFLYPKEKFLIKEIKRKMITSMKKIDFDNIPLSRTTTNNIELSVPVKVT